jgi:hypothetical protein
LISSTICLTGLALFLPGADLLESLAVIQVYDLMSRNRHLDYSGNILPSPEIQKPHRIRMIFPAAE